MIYFSKYCLLLFGNKNIVICFAFHSPCTTLPLRSEDRMRFGNAKKSSILLTFLSPFTIFAAANTITHLKKTLMKKVLFSLLCMMLLTTAASAQVKTFKTVVENDTMVVNASDCIDRSRNNYLLWVRYDYKNLTVRMEVLYEMDEPLLSYRIVAKKFYDKNDKVLKEIRYYNAPWNQVGGFDYSLPLCIYMTHAFDIVAG